MKHNEDCTKLATRKSLPISVSFSLKVGDILIQKRHPAPREIQDRVQKLLQQWNKLLQASSDRGAGLEEAKDILNFNEEVQKVEQWMREKEALVAAGDMGRDYEHCLGLQRRLDDVEGVRYKFRLSGEIYVLYLFEELFQYFVHVDHTYFQGVTVDEDRIKVINQLADRLISQGRTDKDAIRHQKTSLNEK